MCSTSSLPIRSQNRVRRLGASHVARWTDTRVHGVIPITIKLRSATRFYGVSPPCSHCAGAAVSPIPMLLTGEANSACEVDSSLSRHAQPINAPKSWFAKHTFTVWGDNTLVVTYWPVRPIRPTDPTARTPVEQRRGCRLALPFGLVPPGGILPTIPVLP